MVHVEPKSIVMDGVSDDRMRRALQSFASLRHMVKGSFYSSAHQHYLTRYLQHSPSCRSWLRKPLLRFS